MPLEHGRDHLALGEKSVAKVGRKSGNIFAGGSGVVIAVSRIVASRTGDKIGEGLKPSGSGRSEHPLIMHLLSDELLSAPELIVGGGRAR